MSENASTIEPTTTHAVLRREPFGRKTLNPRPKLLFLAYYFPPVNASACVRTWNIAKHLSRLGWDVSVVTPDASVWRRAEHSEEVDSQLRAEGIHRITTGHRWRSLRPEYLTCSRETVGWLVGGVCRRVAGRLGVDMHIGWIRAAEAACRRIPRDDVDVILATGTPFITFRLAKRLSDSFGCPYVLDYRDPWTGNPHADRPPSRSTIQEETKLLAQCAAATIVSHSWALEMNRTFNLGTKLHVVSNGYDPEELINVRPHHFGHIAIVYTGTFYPPKRVVNPVMAALRRLTENKNGEASADWYFHYYGPHEEHFMETAKSFGLTERVVSHGLVSRADALSAVCGASVAVVITSVSEDADLSDKGIVTGKVFETLGLNATVLVVAPSGSDVEQVVEASGLGRVFAGNNVDGMGFYIMNVMRGQIPKRKKTQAYAWENIVKKLDSVLRATIA